MRFQPADLATIIYNRLLMATFFSSVYKVRQSPVLYVRSIIAVFSSRYSSASFISLFRFDFTSSVRDRSAPSMRVPAFKLTRKYLHLRNPLLVKYQPYLFSRRRSGFIFIVVLSWLSYYKSCFGIKP